MLEKLNRKSCIEEIYFAMLEMRQVGGGVKIETVGRRRRDCRPAAGLSAVDRRVVGESPGRRGLLAGGETVGYGRRRGRSAGRRGLLAGVGDCRPAARLSAGRGTWPAAGLLVGVAGAGRLSAGRGCVVVLVVVRGLPAGDCRGRKGRLVSRWSWSFSEHDVDVTWDGWIRSEKFLEYFSPKRNVLTEVTALRQLHI